MHNVNVGALRETVAKAEGDPSAVRKPVEFDGDWQTREGAAQFRATISFPQGETVFEADFAPPMGGTGVAPSPLAYCFWGGLACSAMTFAQEAALQGVRLQALRGRLATEVDHSRALGMTDDPRSSGSTGTSRSNPTPQRRHWSASSALPTSIAPGCGACATPSSSPPTSRSPQTRADRPRTGARGQAPATAHHPPERMDLHRTALVS